MGNLEKIFGTGGFSVFKHTKDTAEKKYVESKIDLILLLKEAIIGADFRGRNEENFFLISALEDVPRQSL